MKTMASFWVTPCMWLDGALLVDEGGDVAPPGGRPGPTGAGVSATALRMASTALGRRRLRRRGAGPAARLIFLAWPSAEVPWSRTAWTTRTWPTERSTAAMALWSATVRGPSARTATSRAVPLPLGWKGAASSAACSLGALAGRKALLSFLATLDNDGPYLAVSGAPPATPPGSPTGSGRRTARGMRRGSRLLLEDGRRDPKGCARRRAAGLRAGPGAHGPGRAVEL